MEKAKGPTVGLGGCLTGFVVGGGILWGGNLLLDWFGWRGAVHTVTEIALMGGALGAALFVWKVAATADQMAREREESHAPQDD